MLNQNAIFRDQLKKILNIINKKHTILRKEVSKTHEVFQNDHLPIFPYEVCFGLLKHLPETNSLTCSLAFFPFIQNIINLGFANEQMTKQIINLLHHVKSLPKFHGFDNELKIQHILLLLVSKNTISLSNIPYAHNIINILLSLDNNKYKKIWTKTFAILTQISLLYINELNDEPSNNRKEHFIVFLKDLVKFSKAENVKWLLEPNEPFLFMNLLSELLDQKYIRQHKQQYFELFKELVNPLRKFIAKLYDGVLYQIPSSPSKSWQLNMQNKLIICLRVCCKINKLYECNFELLQEIIKIVTEKAHNGLKIIGYECINYLFSSSSWMHAMLSSKSGDFFNFLMTTLFNTVKSIQPELKETSDYTLKQQLEKHHKIFSSNSPQFIQYDLFGWNEIRILVKSIDEITLTFFSIYSDIYKFSLDKKLQERPPLQKTYKFCHKTIFEIVKSLIGKDIGEETLQSLLKISQKFINLAGVFGDSATCGIFIKLMCRNCLPTNQKSIAQRHVQINKMILSTANCLGNIFSAGCWVIVWKAFENYSLYYNRYLMGKEEIIAERQNDVQILFASMESIFTQSPKYEDAYLLNILQSLVQVTYECLQNNYSEDNRKIFAFERIQQVFKLNLFRIQKFWPVLISSLLILTTSKVQYFRIASLNLINTLIPISLHHLHKHKESLGLIMVEDNYQSIVLQSWINLSVSPFNEIRTELAISVGKLIIDYGHIMTHGWKIILQVVQKLQDLASLQAIVETFMDKISFYILEVINIIDKVERSLTDSNQKYLCLTLIWTIGDYSHRHQLSHIQRKIYALLLQPEEMFVLGTEARHSSFYILAELLVHNCSEKSQEFWQWIFNLIEVFYNYSVDKCDEVRQRVNFEQILKNQLANLLKIYRKCFILLQNGHDQFIKAKLDKLFKLIIRYFGFRQSQIYQSTMKQVRQILSYKNQVVLQLQQYNGFLQKLTQIYFIQNDNKILKSLITYLPVDIYDILSHSLPKLYKKFGLVYKLVEKVFLLRLEAEQKDIKIHQLRIFFQEKVFIQFWKKMHTFIIESNEDYLLKEYLQMIVKTLHKLILYQDYIFLSKLLPYINVIAERNCSKLDHSISIQLFSAIIKLKESKNWFSKYGKSKEIPIWLIATNQYVKLGYLLEKQTEKSPHKMQVYHKYLSSLCNLIGLPLVCIDKSSDKKTIDKSISLDLITYFYDSECSLLYYALDHYLLNHKSAPHIKSQEEKHLLQVLEEGLQHFEESDKANKAKNIYDLLFKCLRKRQNFSQVIQSKEFLIIKILINKIIAIFTEYIHNLEQKTNNNVNLQCQAKLLIKKLINLQLNPQIYSLVYQQFKDKMPSMPHESSIIYTHPKAILYILTPWLHKMLWTQNGQIRGYIIEILEMNHSVLLNELKV